MVPPVPGYPPCSWPLGPNKIFHVHGRDYMVLTRLSASPRARIFLGIDLDRLETVVIKVGRPGVWGDESGSDIRDLLKREVDILAALANSSGVAPHVLATGMAIGQSW
jgi:hypothetical protein